MDNTAEQEKEYGVIYLIRNLLNSKAYIGATTDFETRMKNYKTLQCKRQQKIYNALKKYGVHNFSFNIIDTATCQEALDGLEVYHIARFRSMEDEYGYNILPGGSKTCHKGRKRPEESRKKMSAAAKKRPPISEETRKRKSEASKRNPITKETRSKMIESRKKGKGWTKHLEETKKKISEAGKGRKSPPKSDAGKKAIAESNRNRIITDETRKKMSEYQRGRKYSKEVISKRVETRKKNKGLRNQK